MHTNYTKNLIDEFFAKKTYEKALQLMQRFYSMTCNMPEYYYELENFCAADPLLITIANNYIGDGIIAILMFHVSTRLSLGEDEMRGLQIMSLNELKWDTAFCCLVELYFKATYEHQDSAQLTTVAKILMQYNVTPRIVKSIFLTFSCLDFECIKYLPRNPKETFTYFLSSVCDVPKFYRIVSTEQFLNDYTEYYVQGANT